jgi:uncharacterized BrkB/YihY/UPF0761 family membrane protein
MSVLDGVALFFIFFLIIAFTAVIVVVGSIPGKVALKRGHPYPDAVNTAGWIGLATGVFWPLALIWAYLPVPARGGAGSADTADAGVGALEQRVAALEALAATAGGSQAPEDAS